MLADFFGKNALAASQILSGTTTKAIASRLEQHTIGVVIDDAALASSEARVTLELIVSLVARLYPSIAFVHVGVAKRAANTVIHALEEQSKRINPRISVGSARQVTSAMVVGDSAYDVSNKGSVVYVGSYHWWAGVSTRQPVGSAESNNPFGAAAAACLANANLFRYVFRAELEASSLDLARALSLFDYDVADLPASGIRSLHGGDMPIPSTDVSGTILVGVGAIGNAVIWALARLPNLHGALTVVDNESVTLSNLQRYVLTSQEDVSRTTMKVAVAQRAFTDAHVEGLEVSFDGFAGSWAQYVTRRAHFDFDLVLTAVDNIPDRLAVQAALPRRILNAWTQPADLGVSRHPAFGQKPCLGCVYHLRPGGRSEAELVAEQMAVPEPAMQIRELLYSGAPVGEEFIRSLIGRKAITAPADVEVLLKFANRPLRHLYQDVFCGGVILTLATLGEAKPILAEAPLAFQSALAGIMLAAETAIDRGDLRPAAMPTRTVLDVLRPLTVYQPMISKRSDGFCLCEDTDYLASYFRKYG